MSTQASSFTVIAAAIAAVALGAPSASAQSNGLSGFEASAPVTPGFELAPGYNAPDMDATPSQRDEITVFELEPEASEPAALDNAINVFAGQTRRFDPGLIGGFLGRAKNGALGR